MAFRICLEYLIIAQHLERGVKRFTYRSTRLRPVRHDVFACSNRDVRQSIAKLLQFLCQNRTALAVATVGKEQDIIGYSPSMLQLRRVV